MIELLHIDEYVYLRNVDIYFSEGLNVITGETGTGKSLLLDIIGSFLDYQNIRGDTFSADIVVNVPNDLEDLEVKAGQHVFSVERKNRRTFYKFDGRLASKDFVQEVFSNLVSIHKQNSHIKLFERGFFVKILDTVAGNEDILREYRTLYSRYQEILRLLSMATPEDVQKELEELSEKIDEVERAKLSVQEEEELERKYKELTNLQQIVQNYTTASEQLEEIELILRKMYSQLPENYHSNLDVIVEHVAELSNELRRQLSNLEDINPEEIESRLWTYRKLRRKYGPTTEDVLENLANWKKLYAEKRREYEILKNASSEREKVEKELIRLSELLRRRRQETATKLLESVKAHLMDLNMNARLEFKFTETELKYDGADDIELLGNTLPTGELLPLRKIASGGELSRIMLAIELAIVSTPILVYDEIDAGVGGMTALKLASKLKELSKGHQVIVVTHLPQIAAVADKHFAIRRCDGVGKVVELDEAGKREELRRMVGGEEFLEKISGE
ncbi:AAA family ATPase [Fervidobacterium thailandense]|uniref:DNA repair protein RecN n=1 Tax=Fervidobacterium thailandense TaxID=1008305 RepID=A0A1E3G193_9BACT|nr:AAA family ATPase [Fervidobacterium thailandense]ODN29910.1 chromosome segregation protein SMC [Fervidobacterium thailandense]